MAKKKGKAKKSKVIVSNVPDPRQGGKRYGKHSKRDLGKKGSYGQY